MNVKSIVKEYLAANGYGGLHNDDCGCFDDDLFPCDGPCDSCEAAYKVPAHCATCETGCDASDTHATWCLTTIKPAQDTKEAVGNGLTTRKACHYDCNGCSFLNVDTARCSLCVRENSFRSLWQS